MEIKTIRVMMSMARQTGNKEAFEMAQQEATDLRKQLLFMLAGTTAEEKAEIESMRKELTSLIEQEWWAEPTQLVACISRDDFRTFKVCAEDQGKFMARMRKAYPEPEWSIEFYRGKMVD